MLVKHERCGGLRADSVTETDQIDFQVPSAWNRFGGFGHIWIENRITVSRDDCYSFLFLKYDLKLSTAAPLV
jgi:hypothetical protein